MAQLPCAWLSADHTFKVSANIGVWKNGVWVRQFDSLFTVMNEKGQVVGWRLTRGTSFHKVEDMMLFLKKRFDAEGAEVKSIYIDNCCQWRRSIQDVFGSDMEVKLDLFHAIQRIITKT